MKNLLKRTGPLLSFFALLSSCSGGTPAAESPAPSTEAKEEKATTAAPLLSDLKLAQSAAEATADVWDSEKGRSEEAIFTLKITVNGKPSTIAVHHETATILEGEEAAAPSDFNVALTPEQAEAISNASTSLKELIDAKKVTSDNPEGLARFSVFLRH